MNTLKVHIRCLCITFDRLCLVRLESLHGNSYPPARHTHVFLARFGVKIWVWFFIFYFLFSFILFVMAVAPPVIAVQPLASLLKHIAILCPGSKIPDAMTSFLIYFAVLLIFLFVIFMLSLIGSRFTLCSGLCRLLSPHFCEVYV